MVEAFFALSQPTQAFIALCVYSAAKVLAVFVNKVFDGNSKLRADIAHAEHSELQRIGLAVANIDKKLDKHIAECNLRYKLQQTRNES